MRYLITSALPYINGIKHLGNLAGSMLPADIYARFRRLQGHDVVYICATDEHGTPAELAAKAAGMGVKEYCDEQYTLQKKIYSDFNLSFDWFGRTSSQENATLTQHLYQKLEENGLIEEKQMEQVYSVSDQRFLPDRYVEGTCPHCGYEGARGDQCDGCGKLLNPTELINPYSAVSGSTDIEIRKTSHLFLLQEKMQETVRQWIEESEDKWPPLAISIAKKWLDEGLKNRPITRDLEWGIPVIEADGSVRPGFENKVFYVWFDAPIGYISATQEWAKQTGNDWQQWWSNDHGAKDCEYIQFMGKDNVAFHTVSFPITLLGSKEPWKMVDQLKAFNWVNWYGGKFSTSKKRGVFMDQALSLLPSDYWRWYLMANAPEGSDFSFTWEGFQSSINADLANNLGNFVNRITRFTASRFDGKVPQPAETGEEDIQLGKDIEESLKLLETHLEKIEIRKMASEIRKIWGIANEYITRAAPWQQIKTDPEKAATSVYYGLNLCVLCAVIAKPYIPETADKILKAFGLQDTLSWPQNAKEALSYLQPGQSFEPPPVLFQRIEDDWVKEQEERFAGV